jgi:Zn-dependent peptidase ImmA (M78 family)
MIRSSGPFPRSIFIPDARIERTCTDALIASGLLPSEPSPIRIDRFIEKQFTVEVGYIDLKKRFGVGVMGACQFSRVGQVHQIFVDLAIGEDDSQLGERRHRSTLAHEAGHGLLHGELFAEKFRADEEVASFGILNADDCESVFAEGFSCRGLGDPGGGRKNEWWEIQANKAMAALLLPKNLVVTHMRSFLNTPAKPTLRETCGSVADVFNVSVTMARYRIENDFLHMQTQPELL